MCTGSDLAHGGPGSVAEALALTGAGLDYLNSAAAGELAASAIGDVLRSLGQLRAGLTAARAGFLRRSGAAGAHGDDGYGSASAWLVAQAQMSVEDARADVARMRLLGRHPGIASALAAGRVPVSCAMQITERVKELPEELRAGSGTILLEAAAQGASTGDLKLIAAAAFARWRSRQPGPGDEGAFDDRYVRAGTTSGGAACISGSLTPDATPPCRRCWRPWASGKGPGTPAPGPSAGTMRCSWAASC